MELLRQQVQQQEAAEKAQQECLEHKAKLESSRADAKQASEQV